MESRIAKMADSLFLGVDIGGTHLRAGLIDADGQVLRRTKAATGGEYGPEAVLERLLASCRTLMENAAPGGRRIAAVGLGVAGKIDRAAGTVVFSPNLRALDGFPIARRLENAIGLPVILENDANVFGLGEGWRGAARDIENWVGLTLGTGVGGVLILGGRLWTGDNLGFEGEIGHMIVDPHGPWCICGLRGCLEAHASGRALSNGVQEAIDAGVPCESALVELSRSGRLSPETVYARATSGDALAIRLFDRMGWALGLALANLFTALGIRHAVLGGGVSAAWDRFIDPLHRSLRAHSAMLDADSAVIRKAALGDDAALLGAARLASLRTAP